MTETKFAVGRQYSARSICDHGTIFKFKVIKRTEKQITFEYLNKIHKRGVKINRDGIEYCKPFGTYSMCPIIQADETDLA